MNQTKKNKLFDNEKRCKRCNEPSETILCPLCTMQNKLNQLELLIKRVLVPYMEADEEIEKFCKSVMERDIIRGRKVKRSKNKKNMQKPGN